MGLKEAGLRGSLRNVSVGASAIPDSVVSLWGYNEGSGTTATDSQSDNDGTINGATYTTAAPEGSHALSFSSGDNVNYGQPSDLTWDGVSMSLSAWFNFNNLSDSATLLSNRPAASDTWYLFFVQATGEIQYSNNVSGTSVSLTTTTQFDDGTDHFVTASHKDGQYIRIFVDGSQVAETTSIASQSASSHTADLQTGTRPNGGTPAVGVIDTPSFASSALSLSEHQSLMSQ